MAKFEIFVDTKKVTQNMRSFIKDISNPVKLWDRMTRLMRTIIATAFRTGKAQYGRDAWQAISPSMYGKVRHGSDGSIQGRYSSSSKPLQASGQYRQSFKKLRQSAHYYAFGSNYKPASYLPYAGLGRKHPRYAMPDADSSSFKHAVDTQNKQFLDEITKGAFVS